MTTILCNDSRNFRTGLDISAHSPSPTGYKYTWVGSTFVTDFIGVGGVG